MKNCDWVHAQMHAYLDGELIAEERRDFESHLADCPGCRAWLDYERALATAVASSLPRPEPPLALRERVARLAQPAARPLRHTLLAAAAVLAIVATGLVLLREATVGTADERGPVAASPLSPSPFVARAVDSHLRYASQRLPLEVRSAKPDEVSRFFEGRVPFHVTLPDYKEGPGEVKFYALEGGRLVSLEDDYVAYVAYRMEGRPISLLVASEARVKPWGRETVRSGALTFHLDAVSGLKVITWSDNGLTYALVSDLAVSGAKSCLVCHGAPEERPKLEGLGRSGPGAGI